MTYREDGPGPARPIEAVPPPAAEDPTWERLEDQISWYDRKSGASQSRSTACNDGAAGRHGDASRLPLSGAQSSGPSWNEPRLRRSDRQRTGPSHRRRGTARKYSNPADQHRPHPTDAGLRPAPATIID